ncbi:MAG: phosphoenolpyruvate carboxylase [Candidatus Limnocylindria bacterium]
MSTQHPDNAATPFFASGPVIGADDEVREAYYAFSHLGCDEQMWDYEGKEVDEFVVEKLLSSYEAYFAEQPLGGTVFLTPRIPNPRLEPAQAKLLLEVLHSLPRHSDAARMFYREDRVPIFELIYPMTTSASELERVRRYYERFVASAADARILEGDEPLRELFGEFAPRRISVIPLIEERQYLLAADGIVRDQMLSSEAPDQRVFIARSDPALNYGYLAAVLLAMVALDRLAGLERELGRPIYPIIGVGAVPFRGGFRPGGVERCLRTYPSVQTFTAQSAFKYDHPSQAVVGAIAQLRSMPRTSPPAVAGDARITDLLDRSAERYQLEVSTLAPLVMAISRHVPRRRRRRLHIGLFGYSRSSGVVTLPRAIPFCASLYSFGLPPEVLGCAALTQGDVALLDEVAPSVREEMREALRYLDPEALSQVGPEVAESARAAMRWFGDPDDPAAEHHGISRRLRSSLGPTDAPEASELILRGGAQRGFLG